MPHVLELESHCAVVYSSLLMDGCISLRRDALSLGGMRVQLCLNHVVYGYETSDDLQYVEVYASIRSLTRFLMFRCEALFPSHGPNALPVYQAS